MFTGIQALHHEKDTLEVHEVTKPHRRDTTSSHDEFSRYAASYKLIPTTSPPHPVTTNPQIYIAKERRCINLSTKEDRQPRNDFRCSSSQATKQYGVCTVSPAKKTTSAIIEGTSDKRLQFQVNWLNISRDTSIKVRPKNSSNTLNFHSFQTLTLI